MLVCVFSYAPYSLPFNIPPFTLGLRAEKGETKRYWICPFFELPDLIALHFPCHWLIFFPPHTSCTLLIRLVHFYFYFSVTPLSISNGFPFLFCFFFFYYLLFASSMLRETFPSEGKEASILFHRTILWNTSFWIASKWNIIFPKIISMRLPNSSPEG